MGEDKVYTMRVTYVIAGAHAHIRIYVGSLPGPTFTSAGNFDNFHLACAGDITLRTEELEAWQRDEIYIEFSRRITIA